MQSIVQMFPHTINVIYYQDDLDDDYDHIIRVTAPNDTVLQKGLKAQQPNSSSASVRPKTVQRLSEVKDKRKGLAEQSLSPRRMEVTTRNRFEALRSCDDNEDTAMDESMELFSLPRLNISNCVTVKLTDRNYILWKTQFESFLSGQGLLGFVTGAISAPESTIPVPHREGFPDTAPNLDYQSWSRSDQVVMAWLLGSLSEDILSVVVGAKTAYQVWTKLACHFNRISFSRVFDLQRRLHALSKEGKTIDEYLRALKHICDQLASVGSPVTEKMKVFAMVHGLTREYEPLITSLESSLDKSPGPTYEEILYRLKGYDDRLQSYAAADVSPHLAFNTFRSSQRGRGRGARGRGRGNYSTRGRGFTQQFSSTGSSYSSATSGDKPVCQICGKKGHPALQCWYRFDESYQHSEAAAAAFSALHITDVTDDSAWVPDSAATTHITNNSQRLHQTQPYFGTDTVMASDGNFLPITHIGSASLPSTSGNLPLKDVLVCPDIAKSLLSVSKLTKDYPCSFTFDADGVLVKDKVTHKVLTVGSSTSVGLYKLENPKFQVYYSTRQIKATDEVWHMRLGHPNLQVLQLLSKNKAIQINKSTSKVCESCRLGKSSRLPFVSSVFTASRPLERVHCDLWGPAPLSSVQALESNNSPYEVLWGKAPDYSALRTFGCACFPTL
ncbi:unnamed protein product [Arabidopsis halleri]